MRRRELLATLCAPFARANTEPRFERIDTHTHMHRRAPGLVAALKLANWRRLTICDSREIGDQPSGLPEMIRGTQQLHRESDGRIAWATTFDPRGFEAPAFADRVIDDLQRDFKAEA